MKCNIEVRISSLEGRYAEIKSLNLDFDGDNLMGQISNSNRCDEEIKWLHEHWPARAIGWNKVMGPARKSLGHLDACGNPVYTCI